MKYLVIAVWVAVSASLSAQEVVLVNTLSVRPLFNLEAQGTVQTRTVAPGNRTLLPAGLFSGLGEKNVPLVSGNLYYLAHYAALPHLYRLAPHQALLLNQSGQAIEVALSQNRVRGVIANGAWALAEADEEGLVAVSWESAQGEQSAQLKAGGIYRWTDDGLTLWD